MARKIPSIQDDRVSDDAFRAAPGRVPDPHRLAERAFRGAAELRCHRIAQSITIRCPN
jgi:hypothetical protein